MDKYIFDEGNGLWYERSGDYYLPCLSLPERKPTGVWGQRYRHFLKEYRSTIYTAMLLNGSLDDHVAEIDRQAEEMLDKADGGAGGYHRATQGQRPDGMGRRDEQHPGEGGGSGQGGADHI